jgi:TPR repeat protein
MKANHRFEPPARTTATTSDPYSRAQRLALEHRYPEALDLMRGLAERGDREAQRTLGEMPFHGEPVLSGPTHCDRIQAGEWFNRAAAQGCPIARYYLDWFYGNQSSVLDAHLECLPVDYS